MGKTLSNPVQADAWWQMHGCGSTERRRFRSAFWSAVGRERRNGRGRLLEGDCRLIAGTRQTKGDDPGSAKPTHADGARRIGSEKERAQHGALCLAWRTVEPKFPGRQPLKRAPAGAEAEQTAKCCADGRTNTADKKKAADRAEGGDAAACCYDALKHDWCHIEV